LVVFLGRADGSFKPVILEKIDDHSFPAYIFIREVKPGVIHVFDSNSVIATKHSGIGLDFCEKSESVYYWGDSSGKFKNIGVSD
jgi:hypothetical protein